MRTDNQLKQDVLAELRWEPSVTAAHIGVTARDGIVTLSGHVATYAEKHGAETAAGRVKGVKGIAEEIEVMLPLNVSRGDDDMARAAVQRLGWSSMVPRDAVKVTVEKGWLTLRGQVDWRYQREAAVAEVRHMQGVVGVSNQITVKPQVNVVSLGADITAALHRNWFWDDDAHVMVAANGGAVKLSGNVDSWHDREVAANTAWAARGTTTVENLITVA